jgi:hypothetical protein
MRMVRFIGDVHGKMVEYVNVLPSHQSIQVGDFGIGFARNPIDLYDYHTHGFIRGNHDNPAKCLMEPNYIEDGKFDGSIFFTGGAESTDRHLRTEGISWWRGEQMSFEQLYAVADAYDQAKANVKVVVSHDAPEPVCHYLLGFQDMQPSRTKQALSGLLHMHRPKLWVFGHYHREFDETIDGTRFVCLPELEYLDVDIDAL